MRGSKLGRGLLTALIALVMGGAASAGGCSGCESKAPLGFVPESSLVVVEVPSLGGAVRHALDLIGAFKMGPLANSLISSRKADLERQLGFDIEKPDSYRQKGLDPKAGLVVSLSNESMVSVVMPVLDGATVDKFLRDLLTRQLSGKIVFKDEAKEGVKLTLVTRDNGPALAGWTIVKKHLLIGGGPGDVAAHLIGLTKQNKSIRDNPRFLQIHKRLGRYDTLLYVDGEAAKKRLQARFDAQLKDASEFRRERLRERNDLSKGILSYLEAWGLAVRASAKSLSVRTFLAVPEARAKVLKQVFSGRGKSPEFGKFVQADALVVARASLRFKILFDRALDLVSPRTKRGIYRSLERFERRNNLSIEKDLLSLLAGRYAFALFAPPAAALQQPPRDPTEIARALQGAFFAQVTDAKKASELLNRLERFLIMARQDVRTQTVGDRKVFTIEKAGQPMLRWTLHRDTLVVASAARLEATIKLMEQGGKNVIGEMRSSRAKGLLRDGDGNVLYQDLSKMVDAARAVNLPASAKLLVSPVLSALGKFDDLAVSFAAEGQGVGAELLLNLK